MNLHEIQYGNNLYLQLSFCVQLVLAIIYEFRTNGVINKNKSAIRLKLSLLQLMLIIEPVHFVYSNKIKNNDNETLNQEDYHLRLCVDISLPCYKNIPHDINAISQYNQETIIDDELKSLMLSCICNTYDFVTFHH